MLLFPADIEAILTQRHFGCEYQPIIQLSNESILAYEALARFRFKESLVPPDIVFDAAHKDEWLFFALEAAVKSFQLEHRPGNTTLFLNLDPHLCIKRAHINHWEKLFKDEKIVVEIIENTDSSNVELVKNFASLLLNIDIPIALDDIGNPFSLFSFSLLDYAKVMKFDRHWLTLRESDPSYLILMKSFIEFCDHKRILTVLEGVENEDHLQFAQEMGVKAVQGFFYRPKFIKHNC
ncbi:EAL domain-containing protein [Wolinella succinogenes]|uniref:EAL domain-containing protein n=1 Tax=Wolinella succinogenes (strain ATCC 29543 / DSM 1740 / CCUG 13145 / JCM 31913 / LMG 7466 / NCTC 11488 / FDC 602W) TaxID=273121 RepID=Q7MQM8_WOLSU|nr:EAL domain-containing protein [Wolinella succinogenes]CAE11165.1 hypothetical protein WS2174 [Wolinella succinogenes]VEG81331.1 Bacteriophytochrome cph2 [Wolinella succinogenes]HCZ19853.1 EAL domain-containing protein [Helicobacter sp.]